MNKIFKVIWSKSKQCYIVVSEIAKNKTGKKKIVVASILAVLTMTANVVTVEGAIPEGSRTDQLGLAIGTSSNSKSNQSVAIGYASSAQAPGANPENPATAVGAGANANGAGAVALGLSANATGANAVALGGGSNGGTNKTEATGVETTAVGFNAKASNSRAAAIGSGAASSGSDAIAFGTSSIANSEKAIAIGTDSKATAIGTTALGRSSAATGASATALGSLASASGTTATAVGMQASATGNESVAIGQTASATSGRALAVGTNAKATGASSVAVGSGAGNSGPLGFASSINSLGSVVNSLKTINYATTAEGDYAVALGVYANAKNSGVAVGQNALAATGGVAIGKGVLEDTGNNLAGGVAIGQDSASTGAYSLAMGRHAFASGSTSMAMGYEASANGNFAVAMGRNVTATGTSTAIGRHAVASNGGLAVGSQDNDAATDKTTASAKGAVAIGKNTKATSEDAVAIGTNAQATRLNSVALGSGSTTATGATNQGSATINGITYNFAGATGNPNMQVSVGSTGATRQIKNVAAGEVSATSTDAINGSQLYAVASAVKPLKYVSVNSTVTGTGSNVDNDGAQAPNSIAIGPSSTVTKQNSIAFGNNAQSLSDDSITIGRNAKAESGPAFTTTSRAIAIGANSKVATNVTQGIAIGSGSLTDEGAVVTGDQSIAIGGNVKVDGHAAVAIGGDDARKAAGQQVSYTNTNDNEVTGTLQTAILNLTGYNLSKYKGTEAGHAGVAYGTSALAGNAGVAIGTASDSMTRMNDKGQVVNNKPVTNAVAIGTGARANFDNSVAIGGGSNTDRYATKQVNAIIDGVEVKWSGGENISPGDVVSFGAKGFERQLKNIAPGEVSQTSTDAINGSQIYSLARKVTNIMNGGSGSVVNVNAAGEPLSKVVTGTGASKVERYYRTVDVEDDGTLVTGAVAQTPTALALVNVDQTNTNQQTQTPRTLSNVADGVKNNDAVNVSQLNAAKVKYFSVNSTVTGNRDNTGATGVNAIAIGPAATATKAQSIALGNSATAGGTDSIAIGNGSVAADKVAPVAIGRGTQANGDFSVALGGGNHQFVGAIANGVGTTALGTYSKTAADTNFQTAVGFGANTTKANATAIGYNSSVSTEGGVALGANSSSSTGRTVGYNPNDGRTNTYSALTGNVIRSTTGAVSVGNGTEVTRQITGVAAGTNDTDAVNVAQLKSVNLAFVGDSGFGDVNLANNDTTKRFAVKGDSTYLTTRANGNLITVSANKKDISVTNGTATAATGMADAKNVAEAINKAVSQNAYTWNLTADNDTAGSRSTINKEGTVKFSGDKNITVARNGNTITSSLNKSIIVDSVKANNSVTTGSGSNQITLDGTTGAVTGNTFSGQSFTAGDNVLSNTTLQIGSPTNGNNVTITKDGLTSKAGTKTAKFGANGIDAGGQQITNVSSGGNVGTNAANITDVKNAVSDVTLKLDTNSKTGTVKLSESPLKVIGANGIRTDLVGTNNGSLVVGLDSNTVNATTKGIGLTGDTGSTGLKYLKDGDASFKVAGDGNLVTTKASATGVQVAVDAAKVKDLAVEAVTVSKANTVDNPITVTPTAGTNSKDYAIGIDTTKLASKTDLTYRANNDADANAQKVSLAKGLNFVNGDNTIATVAADGKVSYDLNAATKTKIDDSATAVARNISLGADSGTASSQSLKDGNVAFNVKGATGDYVSTNMNGNTVEVSTKRATINSDTNTGAASVTGNDGLATAKNVASAINSAVNGLSQNLNISDGTTDSTVALKNQKLTVTGTGAATATVNNQTITVNVAEGTLSNNADGTVKADAAGVATTKNVADVINKSISDNQYSWKLSANGEANTATVGKGDTVDFAGDTNITVDRNNKNISVSLNKNLTDMNSISLGNARGETIFLNGRDGSIKAGKAEFKDNVGAGSTITSDQLSFTNGATGANEATTTIALDTVSIQSGPNNSALTSKYLMFSDEDGNNAEGSAKGMAFQNAAGKMVQFSLDEIKAGGNKIQEVAEGTADTDAVNVKQLKDTVASQTLTYRANTATDADAKSVKLSKGLDFVDGTSTVATVDNDGKVSFDLNTATKTKIDDSATAVARNISLGADSGTASSQSLKDGDVAFNVKGATGDYVSTNMNGNTVEVSTKRATINSDANTGAASVTGNDGLATAKNVADAINKAADAAKAGAAWNLTTNSSTTDKTSVQGGDTVDLINGDNILITQDGTDKKKITVATKKDLTVDSVTAGNTVINTSGLTNGTTAITGSGITTDKVTVGGISIDKTDGINAGGKAISNVASGGTTDTNAANIGDVKQAIANLSQNLNITDGTNNGTVDLKNQKLNVAGANGVTATVNNQTITVGLDADTVNATTKGIGLTADTGSTGNKYLKDGDVSFAVTGDGNLVSTSATAAGVKVAVDAAKVKDLAVDAVTVSKDAQADNPITVTPTAGTNSKDYAIGIDTTKLAAKTDLTYRANNDTDANAKKVSLAKGLNFVNGTLTTASIDNDGVVKYDVNTATITAGTDGTITGPTTDGVATAKNVADAINAAKKASKTEITANTGEVANATTGNVTLTSTTAADGHTIYDVKLNDKVTLGTGANAVTIDGTAGKATVGTAVVDGVNNTITTGGASPVTLDGATGTITGKTANIGGVTVNGTTNDITGLSNTTVTGADFATKGRAATEEQLKAVTGATALKFTGDVATNTGSINLKDDTFGIKGDGKYITTDVNGKDVNLTVSEAAVKKSAVAAVTVSTDTTDANNPISVTPTTSADGTTKDYKVTIDGTKIANKTNLSYKANDGTAKQVSLADGLNFKNGTLTTASIDDAGVVKYDVNTAAITAGTDGTITGPTTDGVATAQNVADAINAAKKAAKTEVTANTGEAANATTGNVTLTSTTAADGHTIYDVKLNDKVTLGTGANAVTIDGTAGKATIGSSVVDGVNNTITTGGTNSVKVDGATGTVTGLTNKAWTPGVTKAVTGRAATEDQLQKVADAASSQTWNITADKAGTTGAQTGTKKNATVGKDETVELVAGDNLTINQDERKFTYSLNKDLAGLTSVSVGTGTTETIKLDGATGKITAKNAAIGGVTVDGDNSHVTGLSNTTWNGTATTGRAATEDQLKAVADTAKAKTDAVNLKFSGDTNTSAGVVNLKDDTFNIIGDGKYVTTDANGKDLTVKVSEAEVKKSAVAAVTVSTDITDANNPISVTPTTSADGTTKDYKVTIDGTKIANKTNLSYKANDGTAKQVSLADGVNFKNGTLTTASIDDAGVVKYDINTATITAGTDGTVTGPTTDGVATAQNVADAINAAKKAAKTEITANTGEAANATTGNVTLTSTTAADGHTIYDVKLNDKVTLGTGANAVTIDGTAGKATIGSSVVDGVNNTITTGGANAVVLNGADGTVKTGTVTVTGGTTNDITGLSNTTVTAADFATKGRAATEEQLKQVGEQTWQITADKDATTSGNQTGTKKDAKVGKDDKVQLIAGENLTVNQNERDFTYSLNKDLVKMNSATFESTGGKTTVITGDSIAQADGTKTNTSTAAGNTVADGTKSTETTAAGQVIKDGAKTNTSTVDENTLVDGAKSNKTTVDSNVIDDGNGNVNTSNATSNTITDGTNTSTITAGKATIGSSVVDGVNNTITTGGVNAVTMDGAAGTIKTGTVTVTGGTTNDITGLSNTTVNSADFATKGRAATEEQLKAVGEQTWQITADKDATTSGNQTGTKKDAKVGKDDKVQLIAGENLTVNQNERDFTYSLNKDLVKMNSATFEATGGKTTVITGDSIAQTDGTKTNTSTAAGNTVVDGGKSTATTADGTTVTNGADSTTTTAAGATVTSANGNTNYAADGVRINTIGKDLVSLTDAGLDNGNNVIKNVASGHVNNDDTDNTNAANIADVKKATTTVTANDGEAANATTGNVTLTSTTATDGHTIYDVKLNDTVTLGTGSNAVTIDGTAGKATIGSSVVDGVNNTITTGGANAVALDGAAGTVKTGTVIVTGGTTNDITGLSNTTVNAADFATKGRAATEEQLKAVGEQTWQITADKDATTSGNQTGTKKDAKVGKDDKVQLIAGENLTVNQNERDFTYSLNKDLVKMNSATFEATGGKTTVITGDSIAQTDGTKTNTSTAAGNTVVDGTKSTETTAAGQVIKDGAKSNKTTVDSNVIDDGNGNVNTSNATSNTINNGADSTATTAAGTTVTSANGNTNYAADGVRINTTGKNPVSLTDAGLDNGNNVIKNVASGHVNNDDTDNTNAANIADVKKATTTVTANDGEAANATTGNVTLTSTTATDGHTIYDVKLNDTVTLGTGSNAVTIDGTAGKATIGSSVVDGVNNTITTGGANAVKLDGAAGTVKTGTVTVSGGTTNDITGLSNTTVTAADFATKGRAATEEQLKAVGEQTWQITADKDAATSGNQTGTKKDAKVGKDDKVQLIAGENLTVNQNERDFTYSLNKDLVKMNSATFEATGGKTTVITGDSIAQTDGTKTNTSTAAGNTVVDGGKSTATTADGTTVTNGADTTATTAAGTTVTNANGNTKYAADGVRINTTGKNPVSLTDAGLDNGNNVIKNVASGHVNNDDTDNTNAANIADVKKATTTVTANNGEAANATTGNVTLTSTTATDGHTIYDVKLNDTVILGTGNNAVTIDGTAGKATIGSSVVDGVNNTITTGGANAVTMDGAAGTIKTGAVTVTGGTTNDITGLSNTTVTAADFATKGRAATEEQLKAVGEQTWQITADKDAATSGNQTGTKKDAKVGKDDKVQLIAGENLTVNQNERDFTYSLNKDLVKMNSATFEATGGKTTVITGDSIAQTDGTKTNRSTAAGNTVADGTKSTETTAAGQVIKDGAKTNTSTVDENTLVDGAKSNKTTVDSNVIDDGNGNVNTSNATSNTITDGTNTSTITAGKAQIGTVGIDGVASNITTGGANAVALDGAAGTVKTGTVIVTGGTTNDITGLSNTTVNAADFATKGRAATEEQLKAVGEQTWQITADKDATTSGNQTGTKKDAKVGKDDKVQLIAGENLTVNQNERDFTYSLNKDLVKMNSATFEATGGKTTVITGDSIAQTDGTKTNRSTAAGNTVADGTKSTETTAAGQVIKDGAKTNTSTVDENTLVDGAKSNKTTVDSNVIDDGNGNVNTSKATSNTITDGTNTTEATASTLTVKDNAGNSTVITKDTITTGTGANKVTVDGTVGKVTAGSAVVDGVNNTITTGGANTVKLDGAAGTVTGLTNTAWTPGVTKAVSGRAATEDQLQQVSDAVGAGWNINSGTVTGSTGEANGSAKTKVSSGEEVQLQAGNNLIIDQNGKTLAYSLNKNLKDMESAIFNATGGKTTVIKGDSIVQTDGGKTNTSNAAGNTVVDGTKSTATTAAGTTITDGAKTNTNTADKNVIDDGAGNTNTSNATSNTIADPNGNMNTATATSNTLADNAGNSNVSNATSNNLTDNAGNSNVSNATSNTLKNAAGDETKIDAKGTTVKDAAGNTTNVAATGATVTNAAGDTTKVEATGTTVADAAGNKATFTKAGVTITKPGKDTVSLTGNGLDNGNNKIVNVADGTNDTDAVNVRQLDAKTKAATTELTANGGESADNTTGNIVLTKTTAPDGHIIYDNKLNDKITLGAADPTKAITVDGTNGTIKAGKDGNAVAINGTDGTIKAGDGTNAVAIDGVNGSVKVADKIALNGKDGKAAIGTVGIDGKDGIITTGGNNPVAVNGKDGVLTGLTNKTWDPNNITSGRAATEDQVQSAVANAGWDATVGTEGSGVNSTPSATPEKIRPNETLTFKAGNNMMVSHAGKTISYAVNPELTEMKSATFKDAAGNTTVTNGNGMTITPGSANPNNPNAGPVSLTKDGLNNGNNQIKGVAPGSDDTDAVNIGQLKASNAKIGDAIGQVAGEVQRVGAHAAAMAALKPIQYDPLEPTQVMAGVGNYRGETAAALGLAHYTNENTMFNVGVSVGGNHNMVNAGVTHKFGYSPEKKNIPDRYKAGPISSVYVMQDEVSSLKKENAEQKYVIADQAARLNTLEAENERQRQELAETKQGLDDLRAAVDRLLASKN